MGFVRAIYNLFLGSDEDEMIVLERIRERKRLARIEAAEKLEHDGRMNIKHAMPGPCGEELREQGRKMIRQAEALRTGEVTLLAALGLDEESES